MFNENQGVEGKLCRPDPEESLQRERAQKEKIEAALSAFRLIATGGLYLPGPEREGGEYALVGKLTVALWNVDRRIEQLLKEIDEK